MDLDKKRRAAACVSRPFSTPSTSAEANTALEDNCAGVAETISIVSKEKHVLSVEVGASVMNFIRGKDGFTQKSIEEDMGVKIIFPPSKMDDSIIIQGNSLDIITKASEKIQAIIDEAVKSPTLNYSHFISLPLATYPELVNKLFIFQSTIFQSHTLSELGIDKSIFINPKTFHLTVLMLKLWNKERVRRATEVLQNVSSKVLEVLENRPVYLRFKGLDLMRGSRAQAHVLYAPVEEIGNEGRLSRACQVITEAYVEAGLVMEKDIGKKLKLHATLINTSHRNIGKSLYLPPWKRRSQPFDATKIFEQFEPEHWGDYHIREAHLSQRFLYDDNGYYHCCATLPFPDNPSTS